MAGKNPYIAQTEARPAARPFRITFRPMDRTVEVDPRRIPYGAHGLAGSILDIALGHGVAIDHACGGVCACSTCHVVVREGLQALSHPTEAEDDQLDNAPGLTGSSRLACQAVPNGSRDIVVEVPDWNRNLARETA